MFSLIDGEDTSACLYGPRLFLVWEKHKNRRPQGPALQARGDRETTAERKEGLGRDIAVEYNAMSEREPEGTRAAMPEVHATFHLSGGLH
jgi:hypothetical protein